MRNHISLITKLDDELVSHFSLHEFENREGWCLLHQTVVKGLEQTRRDLCKLGRAVYIIITCSTRTTEWNNELGQIYGFTDEGGTVSRTSKHLPKYGGIAVDFKAVYADDNTLVPTSVVGSIARLYFDYVKSDYVDGHIHADQRRMIDD